MCISERFFRLRYNFKQAIMSRTKESWWVMFEYSQYTLEELTKIIWNKNLYLPAHVERCELELAKRAEQEINYEQL